MMMTIAKRRMNEALLATNHLMALAEEQQQEYEREEEGMKLLERSLLVEKEATQKMLGWMKTMKTWRKEKKLPQMIEKET